MHDGQTSALKSEARSSRKTISHRRSSGSKLSGQAALPGAFGSTTPTGPGADHRLNGEGKPHRKTGSSSVSKAPDWLATRKVSGANQRSKSGSTTGLAGRSTTDRPPATDPTGPNTGHRARSVTPVTGSPTTDPTGHWDRLVTGQPTTDPAGHHDRPVTGQAGLDARSVGPTTDPTDQYGRPVTGHRPHDRSTDRSPTIDPAGHCDRPVTGQPTTDPGRSSRPTSHRSGRARRPAGHRPPVT